jgi:indolepyruvate decarboxylase
MTSVASTPNSTPRRSSAAVSRVRTAGELDATLAESTRHEGRIRVVEAMLDRHDLPRVLSDTAKAIAEHNAR